VKFANELADHAHEPGKPPDRRFERPVLVRWQSDLHRPAWFVREAKV
jgi:hypothetical protein